MSVPEVEEINISCEAGMEESFPGASAPKKHGFCIEDLVFNGLNMVVQTCIYLEWKVKVKIFIR